MSFIIDCDECRASTTARCWRHTMNSITMNLDAIQVAVAQERSRCARIAREHPLCTTSKGGYCSCGEVIAAEIEKETT